MNFGKKISDYKGAESDSESSFCSVDMSIDSITSSMSDAKLGAQKKKKKKNSKVEFASTSTISIPARGKKTTTPFPPPPNKNCRKLKWNKNLVKKKSSASDCRCKDCEFEKMLQRLRNFGRSRAMARDKPKAPMKRAKLVQNAKNNKRKKITFQDENTDDDDDDDDDDDSDDDSDDDDSLDWDDDFLDSSDECSDGNGSTSELIVGRKVIKIKRNPAKVGTWMLGAAQGERYVSGAKTCGRKSRGPGNFNGNGNSSGRGNNNSHVKSGELKQTKKRNISRKTIKPAKRSPRITQKTRTVRRPAVRYKKKPNVQSGQKGGQEIQVKHAYAGSGKGNEGAPNSSSPNKNPLSSEDQNPNAAKRPSGINTNNHCSHNSTKTKQTPNSKKDIVNVGNGKPEKKEDTKIASDLKKNGSMTNAALFHTCWKVFDELQRGDDFKEAADITSLVDGSRTDIPEIETRSEDAKGEENSKQSSTENFPSQANQQ